MTTLEILDTKLVVKTKTITIRQVYNALKKNGFQHLRETWFGDNVYVDGIFTPKGGCVLAQTAFNLGVPANSNLIAHWIEQFNFSSLLERDEARRSYLNYDLYDQLNKMKVDSGSKWSVGPSMGLGDCIIYWNDLNDGWTTDETGKQTRRYKLPTYKDVADMAHDVLKPFFNEKITVLVAGQATGVPLAI